MRVSKKNILKWTKALRSGEFKQAKGKLQTANGYCCLGVACKILSESHELFGDGMLIGITPRTLYNDPEWLEKINLDFYELTGEHLYHLNDTEDFSFDEIADLLEAVYVHRVLD